jgi:hypothetical protein
VTLPLFDLPPARVPAIASPVAKPESDDVILRVQHKAGDFYHLASGGVVDRQFQIIVLMNGLVFVEFIDNGERRPDRQRLTRETIDWMIRIGTWREVRA